MQNKISRIALFSTIGWLLSTDVSADPGEKVGFTIAPNLGVVTPLFDGGGGLELNLYNLYGVNHKLIARGFEEFFGVTDSIDSHFEMGYLVGQWKRNSFGYLSASIGLSVVETMKKGKEISPPPTCTLFECRGIYEMKRSVTVGVPFQLEAILMRNFIGIGFSIIGNINIDQPYGGVLMEYPFGWTPL